MTRPKNPGLEALRERFRLLHGERRTETAFRLALLECSREVWRLAVEDLARKEAAVRDASAKCAEWRAICEGLSYGVAEVADTRRIEDVILYGNDGQPRILFQVEREGNDE